MPIKERAIEIVSLLSFLIFLLGCKEEPEPKFEDSKIRDYANALYNRQLYQQSVEEYTYLLDNYELDDSEAANINYIIGDIYFERIRDYENALAYYLKIKHLYPESPLIEEVNKKMVQCLERLERTADAQQVLEEAAMLDPSQAKKSRPGEVIAKIGKRKITTGDLQHEISKLPPYMQSQLNDKSKKIDFLKQYIATELFYDSAKRQGLHKDKEVIEATFQAKKNFMVQKLLEKEISESVNITDSDVELYYKAHKEKFAEKDDEGNVVRIKPLEEVRKQVIQNLIRERQQEAYNQKLQKMMRELAVKIYEDKLE
ncbi:hypothetical protein GWO43_05210 [candidate division KSB1 bacterium]|nr:hypothetical protein [candidate division KSB1 bacterium]NIR71483.1 hypothetical protein [candidate division KSB1 bacterium]NIS23404.1 hypothetical protein [candidate division KSB1 bacterium]NIT70295.1 hypothetical protein [candidate division KSB1 bacterium]NIU24018.1 hypothetical protein [candidate division KSB1 bacterium]